MAPSCSALASHWSGLHWEIITWLKVRVSAWALVLPHIPCHTRIHPDCFLQHFPLESSKYSQENKQPALWTAGKLELSNTTVKVHNKMLKLSYNTVLWVLKRPKVCIWQYLLASVVVDSKNGPNAPPFLCDATLPHLRIECVSLTPSSGLALWVVLPVKWGQWW